MYFISDQTDQTELEIVNFINICSENWFVYVAMTTDFFINKDVSKTDETLHDECNFTENKIWDASCCILFQSCDWTESESVNFWPKMKFYVTMTTELFIKYFCNIKVCWFSIFNDKMSVIYW